MAVLITRYFDDRRERRQRRLRIFRTLMGTRSTALNTQRVEALNIIEIEFHKNKKVVESWKNCIRSFNTPTTPQMNQQQIDQINRNSHDSYTKLLDEMGRSLGFSIEQLDILRSSYYPQALVDDENEQRLLRRLLVQLLQGQVSLPVRSHNPAGNAGPFPAAPSANSSENPADNSNTGN